MILLMVCSREGSSLMSTPKRYHRSRMLAPEQHPVSRHTHALAHADESVAIAPQQRPNNSRLTPSGVLALQSTIGNRAVRRMIKVQQGGVVQAVPSGSPSVEDLAEAVKYNKSRGLSTEVIKAIQRSIGVNDDGQIGPNTVKALMRWQVQNGLEPDGKIGPQTLSRLNVGQADGTSANAGSSGSQTPSTTPTTPAPAATESPSFLDAIVDAGKSAWDTMAGFFSSGAESSGNTPAGETTSTSHTATPGSSAPTVDPKKAELEALMLKNRLTPEEIHRARELIEQDADEKHRGDLYEALQAKVEYHSQRDNKSKDAAGKSIGDVMCNLTSLSMVLSYLGVPNPDPKMQYEDSLEKIRVDKKLPARTMADGWGGVAKELGVTVTFLGSNVTQGHDWYAKNVLPQLRAGHAVMLSVTGHIVRLQAVTDTGLIMDDPYGKEKLLAGSKHKWEATNKRGEASTVGEDSFWPWEDVSKHNMLWIASFSTK